MSLLEVPVACLMEQLSWSRRRAVWLSTALIFVAGLPAATSMAVLGWMDSVFGGLLLILGGLLLALLLGWVVPGRFRKDLRSRNTAAAATTSAGDAALGVSPVVATGLVISVVDLLKG